MENLAHKEDKITHWFRIFGWLEGGSFLIMLLVAMPIKYMMGNPAGVKLLGPIHGGLFLAYIVLASMVADRRNWLPAVRFQSYVAAVLPFGTFWFEKKYLGGVLSDHTSPKT
jgi:integral membrane protein